MDKRARILVIGDAERAESAIRASQREGCGFSCCAGDDRLDTLAEAQGAHPEWVMIDAGILGGDETELIRSLRATGFFSSRQETAPGRRCSVEWSSDGTLQLTCCMHSPVPRIESVADSEVVRPRSGFVFEYHAPVKRTG